MQGPLQQVQLLQLLLERSMMFTPCPFTFDQASSLGFLIVKVNYTLKKHQFTIILVVNISAVMRLFCILQCNRPSLTDSWYFV